MAAAALRVCVKAVAVELFKVRPVDVAATLAGMTGSSVAITRCRPCDGSSGARRRGSAVGHHNKGLRMKVWEGPFSGISGDSRVYCR